MLTLGIANMLAVWAAHSLSLVDTLIPSLPASQEVFGLVTVVYLLRGLAGFVFIHQLQRAYTKRFIVISSLVCLSMGAVHGVGLRKLLTVEF